MEEKFKYNTIEEAIAAIKAGKMVLVTDDEDRENEGDLIMAAELCTPEAINFMAKEARGLICMPAAGEVMDKLQLGAMVSKNTDNHETAFSVSIDHVDTTTGISAYERAYTMQKCCDEGAQPNDFRRPGHVFPLRAKEGGVLVRTGHTEATVDLCKLAGLKPVGICVEIMDEDPTLESEKNKALRKLVDVRVLAKLSAPSTIAEILLSEEIFKNDLDSSAITYWSIKSLSEIVTVFSPPSVFHINTIEFDTESKLTSLIIPSIKNDEASNPSLTVLSANSK